jgi:hypothetical protein
MTEDHEERVLEQVRKLAAGERSIRCAVCASEAVGTVVACEGCAAVYHPDCWHYNGGCAVYGCSGAPRFEEPLRIQIGAPQRGLASRMVAGAALAVFFALGVWIGERDATSRLMDDPLEDDDLTQVVTVRARGEYLIVPQRGVMVDWDQDAFPDR